MDQSQIYHLVERWPAVRHFLHTEDRFIIRQSSMHTHLSYALHYVIGKLQTSSYQFEIEIEIYGQIPIEGRICQLCHSGAESEEY